MRQLLAGFLFATLWASAAVATKIGIQAADPLILANVRFLLAGGLMLCFVYVLRKSRGYALPKGVEWRHLLIFALLNTTIYLGCFVLAMREVSAGIGSLSTATTPLFIMLISAIWLKRTLRWYEITGVILGLAGVALATYPLLQGSHATIRGLAILLSGMVSVSVATVYYSHVKWQLPNLVINGWQVLLGGLLLLPFTLAGARFSSTHFTLPFWGAVWWLVIPVSIAALQLWFYLVRLDAVKASFWLFLCPIFGFVYSSLLLDEPITLYTFAGTGLVIGGLYLAQREKFRRKRA
ncbi:DMT family transporter [Chitinophaga japonensis]|uniref:Drug/metabolite transporter (DMT)-like permease n=1 Tax=Chitinophaga japonensis TaxID=104662 RepID=A0A562T472_CHIJA|nr:DMT family transporter [Chitinophaga japonensis]TWI88034.1 drug/metabolite transporter (DMT)-like permease [Chitinophaga japonensis]